MSNPLYSTYLGGTLDTFALSSMGAGALLTSSYFTVAPLLPGALGAAGAGWLAMRYLNEWRKNPILPSKLDVRSEASPMDPKSGREGLLLGYSTDEGRPVWIDYDNLMRHVFIIGQSGVGKTVAASLLMCQHIQNGGGLLFIDGKVDASNILQIYQFCAWAGREKDFRVINPDDPENSNTYNPLCDGDPDEKAARLLSLIPGTEGSPGADHYKQEANQGLTTLFMALNKTGLAHHMMDVSVLLMNAEALEELKRKLETAAPGSKETLNYNLFLNKFRHPANDQRNPNAGGIDMKKLKDTFGGIGGRLFQFGTGKFGEVMNTYDPDVRIYEAIRKNQIVYIALPTMGKDVAAENFGKIVIGDLRTAVSWLQKLPVNERPWPPFMCFCDEAGSYVGRSWPRLFEQARSAQIFMMPAVQTMANFKAVSDELSEMVKGNSWTKIYFKIGTDESAKEAAEEIGMHRTLIRTMSVGSSKSTSAQTLKPDPTGNAGDGSNISESEKEEENYKVSPDSLKALDKGEVIMTYGGDMVYNLRIPFVGIDKPTQARLGPVKLNRRRPTPKIKGAGFFDGAERFLASEAPRKKKKDDE